MCAQLHLNRPIFLACPPCPLKCVWKSKTLFTCRMHACLHPRHTGRQLLGHELATSTTRIEGKGLGEHEQLNKIKNQREKRRIELTCSIPILLTFPNSCCSEVRFRGHATLLLGTGILV